MSRKKKAIAQNWDAIDKQREEANKPKEESKKEEITPEEHKKRLNILKNIGILKD